MLARVTMRDDVIRAQKTLLPQNIKKCAHRIQTRGCTHEYRNIAHGLSVNFTICVPKLVFTIPMSPMLVFGSKQYLSNSGTIAP
mmetsp:Transcript_94317/g.149127  ORF Transcript_94317/g.149127 Transcript_94317/m.149127 type:complete len:84 (-) Transcript_94317:145-396(-)